MFVRFDERSVFLFDIYKRYIAVVCFRLLIQQIENPLGTGQCHYNTVKLLADLVDGLVKAFVEGKEAGKTAQSEAAEAVNCQDSAEDGTENIAHISELSHTGRQDIGKFVGIVGALKQPVI